VKLSGVPVGHSSVKELPEAVTGSLKLTTMFVFTATCVAASAGEVLVTEGAASDVVRLDLPASAGLALQNIPALAVSLEPQGGSPTGLPTGPVLYSGPIQRLY